MLFFYKQIISSSYSSDVYICLVLWQDILRSVCSALSLLYGKWRQILSLKCFSRIPYVSGCAVFLLTFKPSRLSNKSNKPLCLWLTPSIKFKAAKPSVVFPHLAKLSLYSHHLDTTVSHLKWNAAHKSLQSRDFLKQEDRSLKTSCGVNSQCQITELERTE